MSRSDPPQTVNIRLQIPQEGEEVEITFAFDLINDDLDSVIQELVEDLPDSKAVQEEIRRSILDQIAKAGRISSAQAHNPSVSSPRRSSSSSATLDEGDDLENDTAFAALLDRHKQELAAMDARHQEERQRLLDRMAGSKRDDDLLIF
jgi:hypothetical protein